MRIGIFGGSFNPPHLGHINALITVSKKAGLNLVKIIPTKQNPLKAPTDGPSDKDRLEMTRMAFSGFEDQFIFEIDDQELLREGNSYTIDTILNYRKEYKADDLFFIMGMDKLNELSEWKNYEKLLQETNLIITTRPGYDQPHAIDELPGYLRPLVSEFDFNIIELETGRHIQFISLNDVEVSSSNLRKRLRLGRPVDKFLPLNVENYIRDHHLYKFIGHKIKDYTTLSQFCGNFLSSKKAIGVKALDISSLNSVSSFVVIGSGTSQRHTSGLAENLIKAVKEEFNVHPQSVEGLNEGRWVVVDYGFLIVHIFYDFVRLEYNIEALWKEGKSLPLNE